MERYPNGTTKEQWDAFAIEMTAHEEYIKNYKFFLDKICSHLDALDKAEDGWWTPDGIRAAISTEISRCDSMDAPNEPGYYRANND